MKIVNAMMARPKLSNRALDMMISALIIGLTSRSFQRKLTRAAP